MPQLITTLGKYASDHLQQRRHSSLPAADLDPVLDLPAPGDALSGLDLLDLPAKDQP